MAIIINDITNEFLKDLLIIDLKEYIKEQVNVLYINYHGYYIRTIHPNRSYNILKPFIRKFITLHLRFNISQIMEIMEIEMKEIRKRTHH